MASSLITLLCFLYHNRYHGFVVAKSEGIDTEFRAWVTNSSQNSDILLPDIQSLCPYNRYCQSGPVKELPSGDIEPCCEQCSCDLRCYEIGNCCPDIPFLGAIKPKYPCINIVYLFLGTTNFVDNDMWYHVITGCKGFVKASNYPRCYEPRDLSDLMLVSDTDSGRVYKNKHCAMCNDVQNYLTWKLRIVCDEIYSLSFTSFEERNDYIFQNRNKCQVHPLSLGTTISDMSRCYPDFQMIKECNATGKWNFYDKDLEEACIADRVDQNVIFTAIEGTVVKTIVRYKNVYCFFCNNEKFAVRDNLCTPPISLKDGRSDPGKFTMFIEASTDDEKQEVPKCKRNDIWDPFVIEVTCNGIDHNNETRGDDCVGLKYPIKFVVITAVALEVYGTCKPMFDKSIFDQ